MTEDKTENREKTHYTCEECSLRYEEQEWRDRCRAWCREHQSCNLDIIEHAVKE